MKFRWQGKQDGEVKSKAPQKKKEEVELRRDGKLVSFREEIAIMSPNILKDLRKPEVPAKVTCCEWIRNKTGFAKVSDHEPVKPPEQKDWKGDYQNFTCKVKRRIKLQVSRFFSKGTFSSSFHPHRGM